MWKSSFRRSYIAPLEDGSDGEMIIDGSMVGIGKLDSPLHMVISGGKLRSVAGEKSENLDILLKNETMYSTVELGIGTMRQQSSMALSWKMKKFMVQYILPLELTHLSAGQ